MDARGRNPQKNLSVKKVGSITKNSYMKKSKFTDSQISHGFTSFLNSVSLKLLSQIRDLLQSSKISSEVSYFFNK